MDHFTATYVNTDVRKKSVQLFDDLCQLRGLITTQDEISRKKSVLPIIWAGKGIQIS